MSALERMVTAAALVALLVVLVADDSRAQNTYWQVGTGSWGEPTNWNGGLPGTSSYAFITNHGTARVDCDGVARHVFIGYWAGNSGIVEVADPGSLSVRELIYVGGYGTGTFIQTGGTVAITMSGRVHLGVWGGSHGTYELSGTGQLSAPEEWIGDGGTGTFTQTGGTNTVGGLYVGDVGGTYTLGGAGAVSAVAEYIGGSGTAVFAQTGGTNTAGTVRVGYGGNGTYELTDGQFNVSTLLEVRSGGTLVLSGGVLEVADLQVLDASAGGTVNWTGTTIRVPDSATVDSWALFKTGMGIPAGATLEVEDTLTLAAAGVLTLDGGTLRVGMLDRSAGGALNWLSGTLEFSGSLTVGPGAPFGSNALAAAGQTLRVTDVTTVNAGGFLTVNGGVFECPLTQLADGVLTAGAGLTLRAGQEIAGHGTIYGAIELADASLTGSDEGLVLYGDLSGSGSLTDVEIYGNVTVGSSPGCLMLENVRLHGSSVLMEIGGTDPAACDRLIVGAGVDLNSTPIDIVFAAGYAPGPADTFDLFDVAAGGDLAAFLGPATINMSENCALDRATGVLTYMPEPATLALLALGGIGVLLSRRRK